MDLLRFLLVSTLPDDSLDLLFYYLKTSSALSTTSTTHDDPIAKFFSMPLSKMKDILLRSNATGTTTTKQNEGEQEAQALYERQQILIQEGWDRSRVFLYSCPEEIQHNLITKVPPSLEDGMQKLGEWTNEDAVDELTKRLKPQSDHTAFVFARIFSRISYGNNHVTPEKAGCKKLSWCRLTKATMLHIMNNCVETPNTIFWLFSALRNCSFVPTKDPENTYATPEMRSALISLGKRFAFADMNCPTTEDFDQENENNSSSNKKKKNKIKVEHATEPVTAAAIRMRLAPAINNLAIDDHDRLVFCVPEIRDLVLELGKATLIAAATATAKVAANTANTKEEKEEERKKIRNNQQVLKYVVSVLLSFSEPSKSKTGLTLQEDHRLTVENRELLLTPEIITLLCDVRVAMDDLTGGAGSFYMGSEDSWLRDGSWFLNTLAQDLQLNLIKRSFY